MTLALIGIGIGGGCFFSYRYWKRLPAIQAPLVLPSGKAHAIVLVHGFLGFDRIEIFGKTQSYFHGIDQKLKQQGVSVFVPKLSPLGTAPQRAEHLAEYIKELQSDRLILIGHSMGGLDARYAVANLGADEFVKSVVSIGTPHHGTPLADLGNTDVAKAMRWLFEKFNLSLDALDWLTEEKAKSFETVMADKPACYYASVVGKTSRKSLLWKPALLAGYEILSRMRGANDGMVHVESQRHGDLIAKVHADHWAQAGWMDQGGSTEFYFDIIDALQRSHLDCGYKPRVG